MIEIRKVTDINIAQKICAQNDLEWSDKYHVIATIEGKNLLNSAVFSYNGDSGDIHNIYGFDGDLEMLDGLCRAILNIMDINGVKEVYLSKKYNELAQKIGFEDAGDRFYLSLEGFFKCSCGIKREKNDEIK